jgi:hypothetical protein
LYEAGAKHGPVSGNALDQSDTLNGMPASDFTGQISGMLYENNIIKDIRKVISLTFIGSLIPCCYFDT